MFKHGERVPQTFVCSSYCVNICLSIVCTVGCQSALVIRPLGSHFMKPVGRAMLLTCQDSDATPGSRLVWKDNRYRDVPDNTGQQRYVSRRYQLLQRLLVE